jgi:hypothetical protein
MASGEMRIPTLAALRVSHAGLAEERVLSPLSKNRIVEVGEVSGLVVPLRSPVGRRFVIVR